MAKISGFILVSVSGSAMLSDVQSTVRPKRIELAKLNTAQLGHISIPCSDHVCEVLAKTKNFR